MPSRSNSEYGAPTGYQKPVTRNRPKAKEATPAERRAAIKRSLEEGRAETRRPAPKAKASDNPTRDLSAAGAARRIGERHGKLDEAIERRSK